MDFKLHAPYQPTGDQPEAIRELVVEDFPVIVANDAFGGDLYETGIKKYGR